MVANLHRVFFGKCFRLVASGLTCFCERNTGNVEIGTRLMEMGENMLASLTGIVGGALGEENDYLAKFRIGTFRDEEGIGKMRTELAFEFLCLNFETTRTDGIVLTTKNTEGWTVDS
jgi:hypothetical protein